VAADRQALLADFTSRMALARTPEQVVEVLAGVLTPRVGTWCAVVVLDELGRPVPAAFRHEREDGDPEVRSLLDRLRAASAGDLAETGPVLRVLRGGEPDLLIRDFGDAAAASVWRDLDRTRIVQAIGARSMVVAPLPARSGVRGCVAVFADDTRPVLGEEELELTRDLANRAGLMLENSQLYARERAVAETLQRSLLPEIPAIPGIRVAAQYVPAADRAAVGGDWYDVFPLRHDAVGMVVGDVMGHNFDSAALMGKLSTVLRAYAWPGGPPAEVLTAVDEFIEGSGPAVLATCVYACLDLQPDGATLHYSNAGHPQPLVRWPDGTVSLLEDGRGPMLGVARLMRPPHRPRPVAVAELPVGSTVVCFTDGLIDVFAADDVEAGVAGVAALVADLPAPAEPDMIVGALTRAARDHRDDVAILAVTIGR
jgi:serine phosphatase RsbU (regulator of sigma subunit)